MNIEGLLMESCYQSKRQVRFGQKRSRKTNKPEIIVEIFEDNNVDIEDNNIDDTNSFNYVKDMLIDLNSQLDICCNKIILIQKYLEMKKNYQNNSPETLLDLPNLLQYNIHNFPDIYIYTLEDCHELIKQKQIIKREMERLNKSIKILDI